MRCEYCKRNGKASIILAIVDRFDRIGVYMPRLRTRVTQESKTRPLNACPDCTVKCISDFVDLVQNGHG